MQRATWNRELAHRCTQGTPTDEHPRMRRAEVRKRNAHRGPRGIHRIERHGEIAPRNHHLAFFCFTAHKGTRNEGLGTRNHHLGSGSDVFGTQNAGNSFQRAGLGTGSTLYQRREERRLSDGRADALTNCRGQAGIPRSAVRARPVPGSIRTPISPIAALGADSPSA